MATNWTKAVDTDYDTTSGSTSITLESAPGDGYAWVIEPGRLTLGDTGTAQLKSASTAISAKVARADAEPYDGWKGDMYECAENEALNLEIDWGGDVSGDIYVGLEAKIYRRKVEWSS